MKSIENIFQQCIYPVLPNHIIKMLLAIPASVMEAVTEIRLRAGQPLILVLGTGDVMLAESGHTTEITQAYFCSKEDIGRAFQLMCKNSVYAYEQELKAGYITIRGGHRVGITGQATVSDGMVKNLKHISSLNIRLAREIIGAADQMLPLILTGTEGVASTLIISPPRCGKTTLLRDIIRQLSIGKTRINFKGVQIGVVDERSEIAACHEGIPTVDLGPRTDVLDACPKANGMLMLVRSMAPSVIATDELGRAEDSEAVREAIRAGVSVIATIHSRTASELAERPYVGELISQKVFDRYVTLSNRLGPGTIEQVYDVRQEKVLYIAVNEVKVCG